MAAKTAKAAKTVKKKASKRKKKNVYYELRYPGDGEFDFFVRHPDEDDYWWDVTDLEDCKQAQEDLGGYLVEISGTREREVK